MLYVPVSLVNGNFRYIVTMVLSWSFFMTTSYMLWYGLQSFVNASIRFHVLGFFPVCVDSVNVKADKLHSTAISYWGQLDDSVKWDLEIGQVFWGLTDACFHTHNRCPTFSF